MSELRTMINEGFLSEDQKHRAEIVVKIREALEDNSECGWLTILGMADSLDRDQQRAIEINARLDRLFEQCVLPVLNPAIDSPVESL